MLSGRHGPGTLVSAAALTALGDQRGELEALLVLQARVHGRAIGPLQVLDRQPARTPRALGHVVPGELDVHAAQIGAQLAVAAERQLQLLEDVLALARLDPAGSRLGVAVHGTAHPQHRLPALADRFDALRQRGAY